MRHRNIRGHIRYTSKKPEMLDQVRGREWFSFTHHAGGECTIRAQCEIDEPQPTVNREIVYQLDHVGRPRECYVSIRLDQRWIGSGWYRFGAHWLECDSDSPEHGRSHERIELSAPYHAFGTHPICADAYLTRLLDPALGPQQKLLRCFLPSADHRGAGAPKLAEVLITLAYLGETEIQVAAGVFPARHFRFIDNHEAIGMGGKRHPDYDLWVSADSDAILLRGAVGGYMQSFYELQQLQRDGQYHK
jgi:hypothetical protein